MSLRPRQLKAYQQNEALHPDMLGTWRSITHDVTLRITPKEIGFTHPALRERLSSEGGE